MKSIGEVWTGIQEALQAMPEISVTAYETWLAPLEAREIQDGNLVLYVETAFQKGIILDCYTTRLETAVMQVMAASTWLTRKGPHQRLSTRRPSIMLRPSPYQAA